MKRLSLLLVAFGALLPVWSTVAAPVTVSTPVIPGQRFIVTDYGAVGDGRTMCTAAIRSAFAACAQAGGGQVVLPKGDFLCGPIELPARTDFHLVKGATLRMSHNRQDFALPEGRTANLIYAREVTDVQISGEGTIDGQGKPWWDRVRELAKHPDEAKKEPQRPQLIVFDRCERVRLAGVTTLNPPNTHCSVRRCVDVTVEDVTMTAPDESANTDGINLSGRNVIIRRCHIATGDDNIVFLSSYPAKDEGPGTANVLVSDCTLGVGHGMSIGSYTGGGLRDITVENVTFDGTTSGIRMKAARDRGGLVENITFRNVTMRKVRTPIFLSSYYPKEPKRPDDDRGEGVTPRTPVWRNIQIEGGTIQDCENSIIIWGLPERPFEDVKLKNLQITAERGAQVYHAKGIRFEGVSLNVKKGPPLTVHQAEVTGMEGTPLLPRK
ncbi:MAG: glycoside hydrolase family 28 protein [Verrucomicrobiaceae bacterium]|nr:glycoside hydrolase family 28 protein [Verrucomicrobiaceae bacterium]